MQVHCVFLHTIVVLVSQDLKHALLSARHPGLYLVFFRIYITLCIWFHGSNITFLEININCIIINIFIILPQVRSLKLYIDCYAYDFTPKFNITIISIVMILIMYNF